MCTAFSITSGDHYFARNLDLDHNYNEEIIIAPKDYQFPFRHISQYDARYALIGIGTVIEDYPLYYDAINEKGLCIAGLNFPGNAMYRQIAPRKNNIASFELIPWLLTQCDNIDQAVSLLQQINICNTSFNDQLSPTPLHWILSDTDKSVTVEATCNGLTIIENPIRVLTNNPVFAYHLENLSNYLNLSPCTPTNRFSKNLNLQPYSLGMGALGLPGDFSSASRFVRCAFIKENSIFGETESEKVGQVFHILDAVSQFDGCVKTDRGYEKTIYSICCNATKGIFYYTTYQNRQIIAVNFRNDPLSQNRLVRYPLITRQEIKYQN